MPGRAHTSDTTKCVWYLVFSVDEIYHTGLGWHTDGQLTGFRKENHPTAAPFLILPSLLHSLAANPLDNGFLMPLGQEEIQSAGKRHILKAWLDIFLLSASSGW